MSTPPPPQRTLLTLSGLSFSNIPPPSAPASVLTPFLTTLLSEAIPLVDSLPSPTTPTSSPTPNDNNPPNPKWTTLSPKSYPTSTAPVHLYSLTTTTSSSSPSSPGKENSKEKETWIARLSTHLDAPHAGTASFSEFTTYLKSQHVNTEASCTPSVEGVWRGGEWTGCDGLEIEDENGGKWTDFTIEALAVRHRVGRPVLRDRLFPLVQVTCSREGDGEFLVITLHVPDLLTASAFPSHQPGPRSDGGGVKDESKEDVVRGAVVGAYVSVERVRKVDGGSVEWIMATASDAKGVLPLWVQTRAVPGQVAVDVPYFLGWVGGQRGR